MYIKGDIVAKTFTQRVNFLKKVKLRNAFREAKIDFFLKSLQGPLTLIQQCLFNVLHIFHFWPTGHFQFATVTVIIRH